MIYFLKELGFNKSCFWTNNEVLSSETYRIFFYSTMTSYMSNDPFNVKLTVISRKLVKGVVHFSFQKAFADN